MADWTEVELDEESELGSFAFRSASRAILLGMGVIALGGLAWAALTAWLDMDAPVAALLSAPCLALGMGSIVAGASAAVAKHRASAAPPAPPLIRDAAGSALLQLLGRLVLGLACGLPVTVGLWLLDERPSALFAGLATVAAGGIGFAYVGARVRRYLRQGTSTLRLVNGPLRPGRRFAAVFEPGRAATVRGPVRCTLRYVCERHEVRSTPLFGTDVEVICYRLFQDVVHGEVRGGTLAPASGLAFSICVPEEAAHRGFTTRLYARPAAYWQLIVDTPAERLGLRCVFLLPSCPP